MKFRNSFYQKQKNPYIKWIAIGALSLAVLATASWLYINDGNVTRSFESTDSEETVDSRPEIAKEPASEKLSDPETPAVPSEEPTDAAPPAKEEPAAPEKPVDATQYPSNIELPEKPTMIDNILLVNKHYPLPRNYAPGESQEARAAFESMKKEAKLEGINLHAFSTYRPFDRQKVLYEGYVAKDGQQAADRYSARPGFSEHQTGLSFDIGEAGQEQHWASASFGGTIGGKWLKANAHNYGFILRYPEGAENLTGYMHESWHFRYVGVAAAKEIHAKGLTLEQYLGVE